MFVYGKLLKLLEKRIELGLQLDELYLCYLLYYSNKERLKYGKDYVNYDATKALVFLIKRFELTVKDCVTYLTLKEVKALEGRLIPLPDDSLKRLVDSGLLVQITPKGTYELNLKKYLELVVDEDNCIDELKSVFNGVKIEVQGRQYPVNIVKDYKELRDTYLKAISYCKETHNEVIDVCTKYVKTGKVSFGLDKIVQSRAWEDWKVELDNHTIDEPSQRKYF